MAGATLLQKADANGDGIVTIADEAVHTLGSVQATGVSVEVDRTALLTEADTNRDGRVTQEEMAYLASRFDTNRDGRIGAGEINGFRSYVKESTARERVDPDGTRSDAVRGFFRHDGVWYFRNEWGSVARASEQPAPHMKVVDAPAGFDASALGGASGNGAAPYVAPPVQSGDNHGHGPSQRSAGHGSAGLTASRGKRGRDGASGTVFDGKGIFIDQPVNFSDGHARAALAAGFTWIAMQGFNNGQVRDDFTREWVDRMKQLGFRVGTWAFLGAQPVADAQMAASMIRDRGLDFFIADVEDPHKGDAGGDQSRSKQYLDEFRRLQPMIDLGFSTYAGAFAPNLLGSVNDPGAGPMDYKAWADAGAVFMPQVYPEDYGPVYSLANTMDHARRAGWDVSMVKPTIGFYRGETPEYYADIAQYGTRGFSVYLGENINDTTYWARLAAIEQAA